MLPRHAVAFLAGILCTEHCGAWKDSWHAAPLLVGVLLICGIRGPRIVALWAAGMLWALVRALDAAGRTNWRRSSRD